MTGGEESLALSCSAQVGFFYFSAGRDRAFEPTLQVASIEIIP